MIEVTASKQWIHFFLSDRCPPTSNMCIDKGPISNLINGRRGPGNEHHCCCAAGDGQIGKACPDIPCFGDANRLCPCSKNVCRGRNVLLARTDTKRVFHETEWGEEVDQLWAITHSTRRIGEAVSGSSNVKGNGDGGRDLQDTGIHHVEFARALLD
jgi:hypothetical protein